MGLILADNKKISLGELSNPRALSAANVWVAWQVGLLGERAQQ